jgi:hypothetical protein
VHQWLGVQPDLGNGALTIVPQVPTGQTTVQGRDIRLGAGSVDVLATHVGDRYRTQIDVGRGVGARDVVIGATLPRGAHPSAVTLDGRAVHNYQVDETNRGVEVTVHTGRGAHVLTVTG